MEEVNDISTLNINDSTLLETLVLVDSVEMELEYIDDYDTQETSRRTLIFEECRKVEFLLNPGFNTPNSLLEAEEKTSSQGREIRIQTNTTAGTIRIECSTVYLRRSTR